MGEASLGHSVSYQRDREKIDDNTVWLSSKTSFSEKVEFFDVTGPVWNVFHVKIQSGSFNWKTTDELIEQPAELFGLYLPPHTLNIDIFDHAEVELVGVYSSSLPPIDEERAYLFNVEEMATNSEELISSLKNSEVFKYCSYNPAPSELAKRIKDEVDGSLKQGLRLNEIADNLGKNQATLSREFKESYGMTPKQYQNLIQIVYGEFLLGLGWEINDVIFETGFKDFSRFYKQFKGKFNDTPNAFLKSRFK